jgi:predicted nucleic acid-binding protein
MELAVQHHISIRDEIILAAAADAESSLLLSKDMHHGFTWSGVTIVNPFQHPHHSMLEQALQS